MRLRFGDFTFDDGQRLLLRGAAPVHLSTKAFDLLELLVSRRPEAVSKADIQERLWPDTFVSEGNLASLVSEIRRALGETARGRSHIRTVFGFGYAFEAPRVVAEAREPAGYRHLLVWGRQEFELPEGVSRVGRERDADVWVGHPSVSREHARIEVTDGRATLEDLGSKNGTWRGTDRITGRVELKDGDDVRFGTVAIVYRVTAMGSTTQTAPFGPA